MMDEVSLNDVSSRAAEQIENTKISTQVEASAQLFRSFIEHSPAAKRLESQSEPNKAEELFIRFKLWAGNIAAHAKGSRSLDYRLRDSFQIKKSVLDLLRHLQTTLSNAIAIVRGEKIPWDELSSSESDSSSDNKVAEHFMDDTELKQLLRSIKNSIELLFKISMSIREPAPDSMFRSTITIERSHFEPYDIEHTRAKFPSSKAFVIDRLGRAISGRRKYLAYRERHHKKLAKGIEKLAIEESLTELTTNSTEATEICVDSQVEAEDDTDNASQTSYASSVNATIKTPALPREAYEQSHYQCPLCFAIINIHTTKSWKQHVFRDLHPYSCTFLDCNTPERLFNSRHEWFDHELTAHRSVWHCVNNCDRTFSSEVDFLAHFNAAHPDLISESSVKAIKRSAAKKPVETTKVSCPLCNIELALRELKQHLGHHQEQLALFALPLDLEQTDDEENEGDSDMQEKNSVEEDASTGSSERSAAVESSEELAFVFEEEDNCDDELYPYEYDTDDEDYTEDKDEGEDFYEEKDVRSRALSPTADPSPTTDRLPKRSPQPRGSIQPSPSGYYSSLPRVSIQPSPSTYSRLPRDVESYIMRAFTKHAAHCASCADPYAQFQKGGSLCPRGHRRASDVAQYIYSSRGVSYSVVDRESEGRVLVQIEIPPKAVAVKSLLKAIERGMRIETERGRSSGAIERDVEIHRQAQYREQHQRGRHQERTSRRTGDGYYEERERGERRKAAPAPIFTADVSGDVAGQRDDTSHGANGAAVDIPMPPVAKWIL